MLTAKGEEIDRVVGFEVGADDYVVKPFSMRELVLRVNACFRSNTGPVATQAAGSGPTDATTPGRRRKYLVGPLTIDVDGHHVFVDGKEIHLSVIEMRLLTYLVEHRGRLCSRDDLLEDVWGYGPTCRRARSTRTSSGSATSWGPPDRCWRRSGASGIACPTRTRWSPTASEPLSRAGATATRHESWANIFGICQGRRRLVPSSCGAPHVIYSCLEPADGFRLLFVAWNPQTGSRPPLRGTQAPHQRGI